MLPAELHNLYGPTEAAVDVTYWACERESWLRTVPIGRPIANTQIHILDRHLQPTPIRVPGELHIGGIGLARGYHNRAELTAEKFIPDPFRSEPGAQLYKTGDLARYLPDGAIEYLGRLDHQVKIRGFRVELGEIESALAAHRAVREAVVLACEDVVGERRFAAYLTVKEGEPPKVSELRGLLRAKLPEYMIPSAFVILDRFPVTPNGKLDRKALPRPDPSNSAEFLPPVTEMEKTLVGIWRKTLGVQRVGLHDNFFELGGHSLMAVRVIAEINKTLKAHLNVPAFFRDATIKGLARALEQSHSVGPGPQVVPLQMGKTGLPVYIIGAAPGVCRTVELLGNDRAVFAIDVPLPEEWRHPIAAVPRAAQPTVEQLGAQCGDLLKEHTGSSPCIVAGYSFGGKIAFEAAHALKRAGGHVAFLLLLDAHAVNWNGGALGEAKRSLLRIWSGAGLGTANRAPYRYRLVHSSNIPGSCLSGC